MKNNKNCFFCLKPYVNPTFLKEKLFYGITEISKTAKLTFFVENLR